MREGMSDTNEVTAADIQMPADRQQGNKAYATKTKLTGSSIAVNQQ